MIKQLNPNSYARHAVRPITKASVWNKKSSFLEGAKRGDREEARIPLSQHRLEINVKNKGKKWLYIFINSKFEWSD